jgi:hypothetical protein
LSCCDIGFIAQYNEKEIKHFCDQHDSLALLPEDIVLEGMEHIKTITPEGFEPVVLF